MWRRAFVRAFAVLTVIVVVIEGNEDKSCVSQCKGKNFPPCGVWLHGDNSKKASGIYLLGEGTVNFTCSVNALPKPAVIDWLFRAEYDTEWKTLRCSSLVNNKHCRFNDVGEHRVTSHCTLRTDQLTQSGSYRCAARSPDAKHHASHGGDQSDHSDLNMNNMALSADTVVQVFGIENVTLVERKLSFDDIGSITVQTCANPKPDVIWINARDDTAIQAGQTIGRLTALPLQPVSKRDADNRQGPADPQPYCYLAKLFISRVTPEDDQFLVTVTNQVHTKSESLSLEVSDLPKGSNNVGPVVALTSFATLLSVMFRLTSI